MWIERQSVTDEYVEDGECVVLMNDGRVLALSPLASAVLAELGGERISLTDMTQRIVRRFGAPPGTGQESATKSLLVELSELGLVVLDLVGE